MSQNNSQILNFSIVSDKIAMGGQPTSDHYKWLNDTGYSAVFQLMVEEASYIDKDEAHHLQTEGIKHRTMDISFENPTARNVESFFDIMDDLAEDKVFVHCVAGYCTAGLMTMYLMKRHNMTLEQAQEKVVSDWVPNPTWKQLIHEIATNNSIS